MSVVAKKPPAIGTFFLTTTTKGKFYISSKVFYRLFYLIRKKSNEA